MLLGLAIIAAMLGLPLEVGIAFALVVAFGVFVLFDSWHAVLLLLIARSSLDSLNGVTVAGGLNGAALITAMVIVIGIEYIARHRINVLDVPLGKPFVAIVGLAALGIAIAPDPRIAFEYWMRLLSTFLLFVLMLDQLQDTRQRGKFVAALLLSIPIPVVFGLYQFFAGEGNHFTEGYNRILGTFVHPANFGVFLITMLPLCVIVFLHSRPSWTKLALFALSILMVVCVVLTFTRIAWVGLVVIALVIGGAKAKASLLVVPVLLVLVVMLLPAVQGRLQGSTNTTGYGSTAWRVNLWGEEISRTSVSSVPLGLGLGAVETLAGHPAHNEYLRIWLEMGLTGSVAYIVLYGSLFRRALVNYRGAGSTMSRHFILAFLAVLAARLVIALTDNLINLLALEWYFWGLAALALSIRPRSTVPAPQPEPRAVA